MIIEEIKDLLVEEFGSRVVTILQHGSSLCNGPKLFGDIDLVIVLRNKQINDCSRLRIISQKISQQYDFSLELQLIYGNELPVDGDYFSLSTSGCFFVPHLRSAKLVYGRNVFDDMIGPSQYQLALSLLQKAQQYTYIARRTVFMSESPSDKKLVYVAKRVLTMLKDLLFVHGIFEENENCFIELVDKIAPGLIADEREFLIQLLQKDYGLPQEEEDKEYFAKQCLILHEKYYKAIREKVGEVIHCKFFDELSG